MSDKWRNKRMASDYDEDPVQQFESYRDDPSDDSVELATRVVIENGRVVFASHGGVDDSYEVSLVSELCGPEFARATPEAPEHYDITSQRAPKTAREIYKEDTDYNDAQSMFDGHRHKRPPGSHGSKNGTGKAKDMPRGGGSAGWGPKPASKKVGSRGPDTVCIGRLTPGEYAIIETAMNNRSEDLAEAILDMHYAACKAKLRFPSNEPAVERLTTHRVSNFYVPVRDKEFWRLFPGAALSAIVDYLHYHFSDRIARIDAGWVEMPEPVESIAA